MKQQNLFLQDEAKAQHTCRQCHPLPAARSWPSLMQTEYKSYRYTGTQQVGRLQGKEAEHTCR